MNAPNTAETTALVATQRQQFDLSPRDFEEAWRMADYLANSDMVPKDFKGKPGNCLVAIQWGAELGLKTMQAIQNIAVINGRPSLWGDVMLALVRSSPLCEYVVETISGDIAICKVKRRGEPEQSREFTKEDATKAGLWTKDGPWKQYPKRMLQMRARAWALRDVFTDVLKGLHMAEEAMDMPAPEKFMGPADVVQPPAPPAPPASWPDDLFKARLPEWRAAIAARKGTADAIVAKAKTKYPLTAEQEAAIRAPLTEAEKPPVTVTFAIVAEGLNKAGDLDKLADAASLINAIPDEQQRAELTEIYERRGQELNT
jgi:hypothetical protein